MYVPIEVLLGSKYAKAYARSALPDAPVEPSTARSVKPSTLPGRRRRGVASAIPRAREATTLDA
jgi:hypothetical protein